MKKAMIALIFVTFGSNAFADELLLLKPPFPAGLVSPKPHAIDKFPYLSTERLPLFCAVLDIGKDGLVSNVQKIQGTGFRQADRAIVNWFAHKPYIPATLNGAPIAVRMLSMYAASPEPLDTDNCTWDAYDKLAASLPPPASPQP